MHSARQNRGPAIFADRIARRRSAGPSNLRLSLRTSACPHVECPRSKEPTMSRKLLAKTLVGAVAATLYAFSTPAQSTYTPTAENLKARQDFQDDKFGMFIHWGVYSVLGDGEWVLHNRKLQLRDYERLPNFFDPEKFDARAWVALAKAAGMKYITITSRHHDGFAMFDTKLN